MQKLVIEHSNQYVWKSTIQYVLDVKLNCLKASTTSSGLSSVASQLIDWLHEKSVDPKIKLRYKVLCHRKSGGKMHHKHPKGHPKEGVTCKLLTEVTTAMTLCLSQNMFGD
jgi:hypothetical protein